MPRISLRRLLPAFAAALAVLVAACENASTPRANPDSGATLEGTVKVGAEELDFAMVTAYSGSGSSTGKIGDDGKYKLSNVPLGEVKITVNTNAAMGDYQQAQMQAGAMTGGGQGKSGRKKVNVQMIHVKEQYADPEKSGLKTTVNAGANTYNIELPASAKK